VAIKGILFDKDGTLLDFHATWVPAYRRAADMVSRLAARPDLADHLLAVGGYDHQSGRCKPGMVLASGANLDIAHLWAKECGLDDPMQVLSRLEAIFASDVAARAVPVGDLASLFRRLTERGLHLGIATMDSEALARATVSLLEIDAFVSFLCGYDSGFGVKPGPGMVSAFCDRLCLQPAEVLVVGDTLHDVQMGRAAGAGLVVGVLSGTGTRDLFESHCDHILENVLALESLLAPG
jgi:phosphoglycolate phosphatase